MELIATIFTAVGAIASIVSAYIAVKAKNEVKVMQQQIDSSKHINIINDYSNHSRTTENSGINNGGVVGVNKGDIKNEFSN